MKVLAAAVLAFGLVACGAKEEGKKDAEKAGGSAPGESSKSGDSSKDNTNIGKKPDSTSDTDSTSKPGSNGDTTNGSNDNSDSTSGNSGLAYYDLFQKSAVCQKYVFKDAKDAEFAAKAMNLKAGECPAKNAVSAAVVKTCPGIEVSQPFSGDDGKEGKTVKFTLASVVYAKGTEVDYSGEKPTEKEVTFTAEQAAAKYCK